MFIKCACCTKFNQENCVSITREIIKKIEQNERLIDDNDEKKKNFWKRIAQN